MPSVKKSTILTTALLLLILVGSMVLLRRYELDLVHGVVMNTVVQKAPEGYPAERIRRAFREARFRARTRDRSPEYLRELFALSQRLEKVQFLSAAEVTGILLSLDPSVPSPDP